MPDGDGILHTFDFILWTKWTHKTAPQPRKIKITSPMKCQTLAKTTSYRKYLTIHALATEPIQYILKELADLGHDDPKSAFPVARFFGLYRRLWESCVSKHINGQRLEQENLLLEEAGAHLRKKRDGLKLRHDKQLARLRFLEQALDSSRERLVSVLNAWTYISIRRLFCFR
ncbi:hypothetical protein N7455_007043 [Penicillium solitum]|uniref:uncharacterized protein n=1 Tax=Penicillium solitum TaxID=60172 RepID=UPI0032C43F1B|nr:hypothetical protein N7455_007043 [Penicillium solitum]